MSLAIRRALGILFSLTALSAVVSMPADAEQSPATTTELQAQRRELLQRIAVLTDGAEEAESQLASAQLGLAEANSQVRWAKDTLTEHAVASYIQMINGKQALDDPRERIWHEIVGWINRSVVDRLTEAQREAEAKKRRAEFEAGATREAAEELNKVRQQLEETIAVHQRDAIAAEAKRNAQARQQALETERKQARENPQSAKTSAERHRIATEQQAKLLAAHPFGVVEGLPSGFSRTNETFAGEASWYGPGFDGSPTASGAIFDQEAWTVAHRALPFGTILLITRGKTTVMALVNDRGPYVSGRVLDLSHGVASALGTVQAGVADVEVEVVQPPVT